MDGRKETRVGLKDGQELNLGLFTLRVLGGPVVLIATHAGGGKLYRDEFEPGRFDLTLMPFQQAED